MILTVMSWIGASFTLPGIAGIVITIGMAVDANVLICRADTRGNEMGGPHENRHVRVMIVPITPSLTPT